MATIQPQPTAAGKRKLHSLKIDMTPMVDLGFLLITFFIFTATISQPGITRLIMPKEGEQTPIKQSTAITFLLDKDRVLAYEGLWSEARLQHTVRSTGYSLQNGMGSLIRQKQKKLAKKDDLVVLIKPLAAASYQNILAALDEMHINNVQHYALVDASTEEQTSVQKQPGLFTPVQ